MSLEFEASLDRMGERTVCWEMVASVWRLRIFQADLINIQQALRCPPPSAPLHIDPFQLPFHKQF